MPETNFNHYLGLRVVRRHSDGVTVECRLRKELLNFSGVLHGGVTATLAAGLAPPRHTLTWSARALPFGKNTEQAS